MSTEITINADESEAQKLAQEQEIETPEDIKQDENEQAVEPTDEDQPEIDHADILRQAKLAHLVEVYLPEGTDVETELAHVGGLDVDDEGNVSGTPVYRKPQVSNKSTKASTAKAKTRSTATTNTDSWERKRNEIRAAKIAAGIVH